MEIFGFENMLVYTFYPNCYHFHGNFGYENILVYTFFERGVGLKKVYVLYTCGNVDIFGRLLSGCLFC